VVKVVKAPVVAVVAPTVPLILIEAVPVRLVTVPLVGVPNAPLNNTGAPADPVLTARAVAMPVPRPDTPVAIGRPVAFVKVALVGVPRIGVTRVGEVAKTAEPVPVSSVKAPSKLAEVNEPKEVALPTEVTAPVKLALVVTLPAVRPEAVPVMFVPTKADGVPKAGVTNVGEFDNTTEPVPVDEVTPVPPLATARVPVMSAVDRVTASQDALVPSL
jgi:hypothetical protein